MSVASVVSSVPSRAALAGHPAVRAWLKSGAGTGLPDVIEPLKESKKSRVYRLRGARLGPGSVIAKRCSRRTAMLELAVHGRVLPCVGLDTLNLYGVVEDDRPDAVWLLLEDAHEPTYDASATAHRVFAGRWVAALHTFTPDQGDGLDFPNVDADEFRRRLRLLIETLRRDGDTGAVDPPDREFLSRLVGRCEGLESQWAAIEVICTSLPTVLVHGDLSEKHLRWRQSRLAKQGLVALDWETSGWGPPSVDLAQRVGQAASPDIDAYAHHARSHGAPLARSDVDVAVEVGTLLRALSSLRWESLRLQYAWAAASIPVLRAADERLGEAMRALGLT
jgi:hypothetical protein